MRGGKGDRSAMVVVVVVGALDDFEMGSRSSLAVTDGHRSKGVFNLATRPLIGYQRYLEYQGNRPK